MSGADLALFAHLVRRPEGEVDLAQSALLLAEPFCPGLDIPHWLSVLDWLGEQAWRRADATPAAAGVDGICRALCHLLYEELGFHGNEADYYDPRNSFLNQVLERRVGIPITLGIVFVEVARRAGLEANGVSFPGHFLVRVEGVRAPLFVDPFRGQLLPPAELAALHQRVTGRQGEVPASLLSPASKRQVLLRMLNNLRAIYGRRGEAESLRAVLERMLVLAPGDAELEKQLAALDEPAPSGGPPSGRRPLN